MSDTAVDQTLPAEQAPPPQVEEQPEAQTSGQPPADDDAALDAELEKSAITVSVAGDRMVPLAAVTPLRAKVRDLTPKAAKADQLETELQQAHARLNEALPLAEAFKAAIAAQQIQPQPHQAPVAEDDSEAVEFAKHADLYDIDGKPDVAKAKALLGIVERKAKAMATAETAPIVEQSLQQQAATMLARAKITKIGGIAPDPQILEGLFARVGSQPGGLKSLADPNQAAILTQLAVTQTIASGRAQMPQAQAPKQALQPPLYTEAAGGKEAALPTLNAGDRKTAKELGLSEAEYAKRLQSMPWRK